MKRLHDRKHRIAFPILLPKDQSQFAELVNQTTEMHVVPTGKWDHPAYGEMEITTENIAEFVRNFQEKIRRDIPITAGHDNGMSGGELPAVGWFQELEDRGVKGLWAIVKWTDEGMKLLAEGAYKYFSPEFYEVYEDPQTRKQYSHVLVGGALTNKPYFKELKPVAMFSEASIIKQFNDNDMDLTTILAKPKSEWTPEERAFVRGAADELTDEQKTEHADVLAEKVDGEEGGDEGGEGDGGGADSDDNDEGADKGGEGEGAGEGDGAGDGAGEGAGDGAGTDTEINASEKNKKGRFMSEAEIAALNMKADQGQQAFAELRGMKLEKRFNELAAGKSNDAGRFLPKQKVAVVKFMEALNDKQLDQFTEIVKNMPKLSIFTEVGDGEATDSVASKQLVTLAEKRATDEKISFSEAMRVVLKENPDLEKQYSEGDDEDAK